MDERYHPVQPTLNRRKAFVPEAVALAAYDVYSHIYSPQPAMIDVARGCRGGFSEREMIAFLYARQFPKSEWSRRVEEALRTPPLDSTP